MCRFFIWLALATALSRSAAGFGTTPAPQVPDVTTTGSYVDISAIVRHGDYIYVGGDFSHIGGIYRPYLAAFNARTGAVDLDWNPRPEGHVEEMFVLGDKLYARGAFRYAGGKFRKLAAAFELAGDGRTGAVDPWNPPVPAYINDFTTDGKWIYLCVGRNLYAAPPANGVGTGIQDPNWGGVDVISEPARDMLAAHGRLYLGGRFTQVRGTTGTQYLAALELAGGGRRGEVDAAWRPFREAVLPNPPVIFDGVACLAADETHVYAGGAFTLPGGITCLAAVEPANGVATGAVDADWRPNPGPANWQPWIRRMMFHENSVFVTGYFGTIGGASRSWFAILDPAGGGSTGRSLPWNVTHDAIVTVGPSDRGFLVGGQFTSIAGESHQHLAGFDIWRNSAARGWALIE